MTASTSTIAPPAGRTGTRMFFIDNLRVWLIVLVILHHLAITFGRSGPWYYVVAKSPGPVTLASIVFALINQAYFMGLFFGISAYFTPGSLDRKGVRRFVRERALRLGVPLALFVLVLGPLAGLHAALTQPGAYTIKSYLGTIGFGPLWFVELLIIFTAVYLGIRRGRPAPEPADERLRGRTVIIFTAVLVLATYLWRLLLPFGSFIPGLDLASPYELPQYAAFFVVGVVAYRRGWLTNLPSRFGVIGGIVAAAVTVVIYPIALSDLGPLFDRGTWQSGLYALWEQTFAVSISLAMVVFFRRFLNRPTPLGTELGRSAFAAYVVHAPLITWLAVALQPLGLPTAVGFVIAAVIGVPVVFAAAAGVRRLPGLRRVF